MSEWITDEQVEVRVREAVQRGIDLLNRELGPEWPGLVDQETLDLVSPDACVLGQLYEDALPTDKQAEAAVTAGVIRYEDEIDVFGGYYKGLAILDGDVMLHPDRYGFSMDDALEQELSERWHATGDNHRDQWSLLQEAWQENLAALKAKIDRIKVGA
jgi:hypothetical protein